MSDWLAYPAAFLFFLVAGVASGLLARFLTRKVSVGARELEARSILPGYDCGLCGEESCRAFAALVEGGGGDLGRCPPGGSEVERRLRRLFEGPEAAGKKAVVRCGATREASADLFEYSGIGDCAVAKSIFDGPRACRESCLGYGTCVPRCPVGAIGLSEGLAVVDPALCTGCGACVDACPTKVIALVPADDPLYVACNSKLDASRRMELCAAACNGCRACERPYGAPSFVVGNGLASRSSWKIAETVDFVRSCPTGVIREPRSAAKSGLFS